MSGSAVVVRDEGLRAYDFGPAHPLAPVRVELTFALADELGVLAAKIAMTRGRYRRPWHASAAGS